MFYWYDDIVLICSSVYKVWNNFFCIYYCYKLLYDIMKFDVKFILYDRFVVIFKFLK